MAEQLTPKDFKFRVPKRHDLPIRVVSVNSSKDKPSPANPSILDAYRNKGIHVPGHDLEGPKNEPNQGS